MAETYLLEGNDLAKNLASLNTTIKQAFAPRQGGIVAMASPQNPQQWGMTGGYHNTGSYMSVHRVNAFAMPQPGGGGPGAPLSGTVYPPGTTPPGGFGGGGGAAAARPQYGGGYSNGGYGPPGGGGGGGGFGGGGGGGGNPLGNTPMPTPPPAMTVPPSRGFGIGGSALWAWDTLVGFGEEKLPKEAAMQYYAARAQRQFSKGVYGNGVAQRDRIKGQIFGSRMDSTLSQIAHSPEDAMSADWIIGNYAGSRDLSATGKAVAANASFRAMALSNPYASATSTAATEEIMASAGMQRRAISMGLPDTYKNGVYNGTTRAMEDYIQTVYGRMITPEEYTRSMASGQKARATFETYTKDWSPEAKENFRAQQEAYIKARKEGATPFTYEKTLWQASQDDSDPQQKPRVEAAREQMKKWGFNDHDIIAQNRKRAITDAKDAGISEGFMQNVTGATDALGQFEKAINKFLEIPFFKKILEVSGGAATVNPVLQSGWSIANGLTGGSLGFLAKFLGFGASPGGEQSSTAGKKSGGGNSSPASPKPTASGTGTASTTPANASEKLGKGSNAKTVNNNSKRSTPSAQGAGSRSAVVNYALAQRGTKYVYGGGNREGPSKGGFDCSSLVQAAHWHGAHVDISRTTYTQMYDDDGRDISPKDAQPGDLVYVNSGSHVRMYLGPNKYVHAPRTGDVVRVVNGNPFQGLVKVRTFLGPHAGKVDVSGVGGSTQSHEATGGDPSGGKAGLGNSVNASPDAGQAPNNEVGSSEEIDAIKWFFQQHGAALSTIEERQQALDLERAKNDPNATGSAGTTNGKSISGGSSNVSIPKVPKGNATAETNKQLGRQMAEQMYHWADRQWDALNTLWQHESNWNHLANNPGSGAYGIPQSLPGSKMASEGADWKTNPETQIKWGLKYIKGRYGTPVAAWKHWQAAVPIKGKDGKMHNVGHWYETGAWEIPEDQPAMLHKGEMVVEAPAAEKIRDVLIRTHAATGVSASAKQGGFGGGNVTFHFAPGSIALHVGQGVSTAAARQTAAAFVDEIERVTTRKKIAKGY